MGWWIEVIIRDYYHLLYVPVLSQVFWFPQNLERLSINEKLRFQMQWMVPIQLCRLVSFEVCEYPASLISECLC